MNGQAGDASKEMTSCKDLTKSLKDDDVTVIGFFNSKDDPEFQVYTETGMKGSAG